MLLIFDIHHLNGALFLEDSFLSLFLLSPSPSIVIVSFTTIYSSLQSRKSDLKIEVVNLTFLLAEY